MTKAIQLSKYKNHISAVISSHKRCILLILNERLSCPGRHTLKVPAHKKRRIHAPCRVVGVLSLDVLKVNTFLLVTSPEMYFIFCPFPKYQITISSQNTQTLTMYYVRSPFGLRKVLLSLFFHSLMMEFTTRILQLVHIMSSNQNAFYFAIVLSSIWPPETQRTGCRTNWVRRTICGLESQYALS